MTSSRTPPIFVVPYDPVWPHLFLDEKQRIEAAIDEAVRCKATGEPKAILFNLTGHGHFDMASYDRYLSGKLEDFDYPAEAIQESLAHLPKV